MKNDMLLELNTSGGLIPAWFPSTMQAFLFRNWGMVDKSRLAKVLGTSEENVAREAQRMGLGEQGELSTWLEKGYITIIRANWHLLPYDQLLQLLGWSEEKLVHILKEDDFLGIKLGNAKPVCKPVVYQELTEAQKQETVKIRAVMEELAMVTPKEAARPFDFIYGREVKEASSAEGQWIPTADQIAIDGSWYVADQTKDPDAAGMARQFVATMKDDFGIDLNGGSHEIVLKFLPDCLEEEYHEILITKEKVEVNAGGSSGILRALYRMEEWMKGSGGPFLPLGSYRREPRFGVRMIYSFCGLYDQAFDVDSRSYCPDELLEAYARAGINGIWLQAILYRMTEFPFAPGISEGWQRRQANLADFVTRAKAYGIKIYLYLNEPRFMSPEFFEKYPQLKGAEYGTKVCMCTSVPETEAYLRNAVKSVCQCAPGLGGFFTITMSENLTHCKSLFCSPLRGTCERCREKATWELVAHVNRVIAEAAHSIDPKMLVAAWDWGWVKANGFEDGDVERCIRALPKDVAIMCKRETGISFTRGGVSGTVSDYTISVDGISEDSRNAWTFAKNTGHETMAKVQVNNTWECSTTPYLPVYRKLFLQMESLMEMNVNHLMLSWTLGGYPSPNIRLLSELFFMENGRKKLDFDRALKNVYGDKADMIKKATDIFCEAFSEFPFHVGVLYKGPQNGGPSNLIYHEPTGYEATMTCYAYDDLKSWSSIYPPEILEQQFDLVSRRWKEGLEVLETKEDEFSDIAYFSYSLFRTSYHQVRFVRLRNRFLKNKEDAIRKEMIEILQEEEKMACEVYQIMCRRPEIGYEAANHYYFGLDGMREKIINCQWLIEYYEKMQK